MLQVPADNIHLPLDLRNLDAGICDIPDGWHKVQGLDIGEGSEGCVDGLGIKCIPRGIAAGV